MICVKISLFMIFDPFLDPAYDLDSVYLGCHNKKQSGLWGFFLFTGRGVRVSFFQNHATLHPQCIQKAMYPKSINVRLRYMSNMETLAILEGI
jgi:hypothetical protein